VIPFNHFDFLAHYYDRFMRSDTPARISGLLEVSVSGLLLDAGGGTGGKSFPLLKMVSGIVVADSSLGMVSEASKKPGLMAVCSETEHLPFKAGSFEMIMMVDALHHLNDYRLTANELWRVIKPAGRIVIEEPDIRTFAVKIMAVIEKLALMRSHFKSPQEIVEAFEDPNARVRIEVENSTAWIIIRKLSG
jgi:ubiquinone/menaquinone biosynthesis C-methylase UbiE